MGDESPSPPTPPRADDERDEDGISPTPAQRAIIRSDAYPMRVLAGAGTGKTRTMVWKIRRLIERGVPPDRILALTFTNKAADSMREQLVDEIGPKGYDIEAYTYHSICHEILQDFAYHADLDPRYDIATEPDQFAIVYDVLDEIPYRFTNPDVYEDVEFATGAGDRLLRFIPAMKRAGITPSDLEAYLPEPRRLIELESVVERILDAVEEQLRVSWRSPSEERIEAMIDGLNSVRNTIREAATDLDEEGAEADVRAYLDAMDDTCGALSTFLEDNTEEIVEGELKYAFKLPAHLFGSYSGAPKGMPHIAYALPEKLGEFIERCQTLSDLTPGYRAYERRLDEENLLDFNDLVLRTVELLEDEGVSELFDGRYEYVFCDEYQDTDTVQFELVRRLLSEDNLFVVGDDDQAIYEWRGANIENIGPRLDEAFPSLADKSLEENHRSRQPILDLANNALDRLEGRASAKQLEAVGEKAEATDGVITITAEEEPEDEAAQIANAISRLLSEKSDCVDESYEPGDVAILVRKKRHAKPIADALTSAGIPYELGGDLAARSPGVETVIAALKAIADPDDEVSLNRVLRMRYRLCDADLERLNDAARGDPDTDESGESASLQDALLSLPSSAFEEPDRVETAREHFGRFWEEKETQSLSRLYRDLKSTLRIEWYVSEQERRDLRALDEVIAQFDQGAVQPELSAEFIDFLAHHETIADASDREMEDQPDPSDAQVSIMTIHKSKGLDFPVVVLPQLCEDEWTPGARTHDLTEHVLTGGSPLDEDFDRRDAREQRRLLHVGITRAEERVLLVGRSDDAGVDSESDADDDETVPLDVVADLLPETVPWDIDGASFPVWETVRESRPPSAIDGTATLAAPVDVERRAAAVDGNERLSRADARQKIATLADKMLDGTLDAPEERDSSATVDPDVLGTPPDPALLRRHSYTSLDTLGTCARRHYLDHVVRAFDDPGRGADSTSGEGPSARIVGILFHETAERAVERGYSTKDEWISLAERIATTRGDDHALPAVRSCIDRYFRTEVPDWEMLAAERAFELEFAGEAVVGQIDALCRRPNGELVVLDFKATANERSLDSDLQLPIYLLACESLFEESVQTAGYVYVGEIGPRVELRTFSEADLDEARRRLVDRVGLAAESSFDDYTPGKHCRWCPHRSLPCSNEADLGEQERMMEDD